jgi:hypothetical protein
MALTTVNMPPINYETFLVGNTGGDVGLTTIIVNATVPVEYLVTLNGEAYVADLIRCEMEIEVSKKRDRP